jgi:hypothetical protein
LATKDITLAQKAIWRYLQDNSHLDDNLSCRATHAQIADGTGLQKTSINGMVAVMEKKGYLSKRATKMFSGVVINTYILKLPEYILEKIRQAPKRGERRDIAKVSPEKPYIDSRVTNEKPQAVRAAEKLSTGGEEKQTLFPESKQNEPLQNGGAPVPAQSNVCSSTEDPLWQHRVPPVADESLILDININTKNNNNINLKPPAVDNIEPAVKKIPDDAKALLNEYYSAMKDLAKKNLTLPLLRRSAQAQEGWPTEKIEQLILLLAAPEYQAEISATYSEQPTKHQDAPNHDEQNATQAGTSTVETSEKPEPMATNQQPQRATPQQAKPTLSQETANKRLGSAGASMDMVEVQLEDEKFLVEKSVQKRAVSKMTQAYNYGRIKGAAAKKPLTQLIQEVLFYACTGNQDKTQLEKCNSAIYICQAGTWGTPRGINNKAIYKREMAAKQYKLEEIRAAKNSTLPSEFIISVGGG